MFCTDCGNQIPDTAKFCTSCGKPLRRDPPRQVEEGGNLHMAATHGPVADGARARPSDPDSADSSKWLFFSSLYANAIEYLREGPRPDACHDLVLHLCTVSGELLKRVPPGASSMPDKGDVALFEPMAYITLAALILREFRKFSDPEYEARRNELAAVWQATLRAARAMDASDFSADPGAPPPF